MRKQYKQIDSEEARKIKTVQATFNVGFKTARKIRRMQLDRQKKSVEIKELKSKIFLTSTHRDYLLMRMREWAIDLEGSDGSTVKEQIEFELAKAEGGSGE